MGFVGLTTDALAILELPAVTAGGDLALARDTGDTANSSATDSGAAKVSVVLILNSLNTCGSSGVVGAKLAVDTSTARFCRLASPLLTTHQARSWCQCTRTG